MRGRGSTHRSTLLTALTAPLARHDHPLGTPQVKQGPFPFAKLVRWGRAGQLDQRWAVQDERTNCWVPLWYLLVEASRADGATIGAA